MNHRRACLSFNFFFFDDDFNWFSDNDSFFGVARVFLDLDFSWRFNICKFCRFFGNLNFLFVVDNLDLNGLR